MNVLLCSVGRRPYLGEWFKDAQGSTGSNGLVVTADADPFAPSQAFADLFELAPLASDPGYPEWLAQTLKKHDIGLAVSVNDFELSAWGRLPENPDFAALLRLSPELQRAAEDKLEMHKVLSGAGVNVPTTWLLRGVLEDPSLVADCPELVLKGRYGSASRGLRLTSPEQLEEDALAAHGEVTHPDGSPAEDFVEALDLFVVQPRIEGQEFGVDVVNDLDGEFAGALARRKVKIRFGETDQAVSVGSSPFEESARALSAVTKHRGSVDTDFIVDTKGTQWLIDLNLRFGGGYPFSHLSGANVPAAYLNWATGSPDANQKLAYRTGVAGAKHVSVAEALHA